MTLYLLTQVVSLVNPAGGARGGLFEEPILGLAASIHINELVNLTRNIPILCILTYPVKYRVLAKSKKVSVLNMPLFPLYLVQHRKYFFIVN